MKGIDIIRELPPEQKVTVQGDVSEEYAANWWQEMCEDAAGFHDKDSYLEYRHKADCAVIDTLVELGSSVEEHVAKNGKYKIGSIFKNKKAYSNYRSNKSIIGGCIEQGVPLHKDGGVLPKTEAQKQLKEKRAEKKPERTAMDKAISYVDKLKNVWGELDSVEQDDVKDALTAMIREA